jgi:GNAT superfamily N-acetyltransferase
MESITIDCTDQPPAEDLAAVDRGLHAFNLNAARLGDVRPLAAFARSPEGTLVGGAVARTWGECCDLRQIWVRESDRRRGIGRELLRRIEEEARARGCRLIYLDTFTFQAPDFYRGLGYETVCELHGYPEGATKFFMRKEL